MKKSIAILGAGVGGLTTAIALYKKGLREIIVYERGSPPRGNGAGMVLWPNASQVLAELDILSSIKKVSGRISKMERITSKGEYLNEIDIKRIEYKMEYQSFPIAQKDLIGILWKKAKQLDIQFKYGYEVSDIRNHNEHDKAEIIFKNNSSSKHDLVLGADGRMNSISRKYVTGDNTPNYLNYINWVGIVEAKKPLLMKNNVMVGIW